MANSKKIDYVLLGLLSHESMTGYEMKKVQERIGIKTYEAYLEWCKETKEQIEEWEKK